MISKNSAHDAVEADAVNSPRVISAEYFYEADNAFEPRT